MALALVPAVRAWGARQAALECLALVAYGFLLERVAMAVFASHRYTDAWRVAPGGVPLAVPVAWAAVILASARLARDARTPGRRALRAGLLAATLDLGIEPAAVHAGLWEWTPPGAWLGVPVGNSVGWLVIVSGYVWGLERWPPRRGPAGVALRLALAAGCVAALVAVGQAWTLVRAERLFDGPGGWAVWAAALAATAVLLLRRARGGGEAFAALALLVIALTFLADAVAAPAPVRLSAAAPTLLFGALALRASLRVRASARDGMPRRP